MKNTFYIFPSAFKTKHYLVYDNFGNYMLKNGDMITQKQHIFGKYNNEVYFNSKRFAVQIIKKFHSGVKIVW